MSEMNTRAIDPNLIIVTVWDNSGETLLARCQGLSNRAVFDETGVISLNGEWRYEYTGNGKLLGFATTPNAAMPEYIAGDTMTLEGINTLYLVSVEYETAIVEYNGTVLGTVKSGSPKILNCANKIMKSNVKITKI